MLSLKDKMENSEPVPDETDEIFRKLHYFRQKYTEIREWQEKVNITKARETKDLLEAQEKLKTNFDESYES